MAEYYIYFAEATNGLVKIGLTKNMPSRLRALRTMSPIPVRLLHAVSCDGKHPHIVEADFHSRFAKQRHHGEWFKLTKIQKKEIMGIESIDIPREKDEPTPCPNCLKYVKGKRGLTSHRRCCPENFQLEDE